MGRGFRWLSALLATVPIAALIVGMLVDRGPLGSVRVSVFHVALTALDPAVWEAARNSLLLALATTLGAWIIGMGLAWLGRHPFRGGRGFWALAMASLGIAPIVAAIGWRALLEQLGPGFAGPGRWASALAVEWSWSVPIVALAARRGLREVEPVWEDALRLAGAGPWRISLRVIRPIVRPHTSRALALVFSGALIEPAAPLVLGLRRTLAYQIVESALDKGDFNRAAVLSLLAGLLAWLVRVLLVRGRSAEGLSGGPSPTIEATHLAVTGRRALAASIGLGLWFLFAIVPLIGLIQVAEVASLAEIQETVRLVLGDPTLMSLLGHSALLGGLVATLGLPIAWLLEASVVGQRGDFAGRLVAGFSKLPAMALAVGVLMIPNLLRMLAFPLSSPEMPEIGLAGALTGLIRLLDPVQSPWILLVLTIIGLHLPPLMASIAALRASARPVLFEVARTLGASRRRARWSLGITLIGPPMLAVWLRVATVSALNFAVALMLSPSTVNRTLGPGLFDLTHEPEGLRSAALLALVATLANFASLRLVARRGLVDLIEEVPR